MKPNNTIFLFFLLFSCTATAQVVQRGQSIIGEEEFAQLRAVSLSEDGNTMLTLEDTINPNNFIFANNQVWEFEEGAWVSVGNLALDIIADVAALSADGSTAVIANDFAAVGSGTQSGVVGVYVREDGVFVERGLFNGGDLFVNLGTSIAVSEDGSRVIAGAPGGNDSDGFARVYERDGMNNYMQIGQDVGVPSEPAFFSLTSAGTSVAISHDGGRIAVAAPDANTPNSFFGGQGRIALFEFDAASSIWVQVGDFLEGDFELEGVGQTIAMNGAGTRVATFFGARGPGTTADDFAIQVHDFDGQSWSQVGSEILLPPNAFPGDIDLIDLDISTDGTRVVLGVGANDPVDGDNDGLMEAYEFTSGEWVQIFSLPAPEGSGIELGSDVSISGDGRFVAGVDLLELDNDTGGFLGRARVFNSEEQEALPVTWQSFTGRTAGKANLLNWVTTAESDNAGFQIERSTDGFNFRSIGWINGTGNTSNTGSYSYEDNEVEPLNYYYRLKQKDFDGGSDFSDVILIGRENALSLSLYPTIASAGQPFRVLTNTDKQNLMVTDINGRVMQTAAFKASAGGYQLTLGDVPAGLYVLSDVASGEARRVFVR